MFGQFADLMGEAWQKTGGVVFEGGFIPTPMHTLRRYQRVSVWLLRLKQKNKIFSRVGLVHAQQRGASTLY